MVQQIITGRFILKTFRDYKTFEELPGIVFHQYGMQLKNRYPKLYANKRIAPKQDTIKYMIRLCKSDKIPHIKIVANNKTHYLFLVDDISDPKLIDGFYEMVCGLYGISSKEAAKSRLRKREHVAVKQICMTIFHLKFDLSQHAAAGYFNRDHATCNWAIRQVAAHLKYEKDYAEKVGHLFEDVVIPEIYYK